MKTHMKALLLALALSALTLLYGCSAEEIVPSEEPATTAAATKKPAELQPVIKTIPEPSVDETPLTRAMAAKMIAVALNSLNSIDYTDREITFYDTSPEKWYDKYINTVYIQGFMSGSGENFAPEEYLTIQHAQYLLDKLDPNNTIKLEITNPDIPISLGLWTDLLLKVLSNAADGKTVSEAYGIEEKTIVTLATSGNNSQLKAHYIITDSGPMTSNGIVMDAYTDKEVSILYKDNEILCVLSVVSQTPTIKNAYIVGHTKDTVTIFTGGAERTYKYKNEFKELNLSICDITINMDEALDVTVYSNKLTGTIKRVGTDIIELENESEDITILQSDKNMKVYGLTENIPKWRSIGNLIVGTDIAQYITDGDTVLACLILKTAVPGDIRIAINKTGFTGLIHEAVAVTGTGKFIIDAGEQIYEYDAWELVNIPDDLYGQQRVYVKPTDGKIGIYSIQRNWAEGASPKYRGIIEIAKEEGGFTIINELPIEEYLYAVVPSEMPTAYGLEAAKAQAITARSYAYNQYFANKYHKYGANIEDSVLSQVYNNIPENDISIAAVDDTNGQCLVFGGSVISANFFSTSGGMTANSGEVWSNSTTRQFPTSSASYLRAKKQYTGNDYGDLSSEENAAAFFKSTSIGSYDSSFNWFRWNVSMTAEEITASINANIAARYTANPNLIKTLQPDGLYRSRPISQIDLVTKIEILKRGEGGNIMSLKITAGDMTIVVDSEYNIRTLIRPFKYISDGRDIILNRSDGSKVSNYSIMPSAFFTMEMNYNSSGGISDITFYGGGNGHGVGMSQNGVKGMIDSGFAYNEILNHYYEGTEIKKMY